MPPNRPTDYPEFFATLWQTRHCETNVTEFFTSRRIPEASVQRGMYLTTYYARRLLPIREEDLRSQRVQIELNVAETRFMVLALGGENPRPELEPARRSVGIRLTKRNIAIKQIQKLRSLMFAFETPEFTGRRKSSTPWTSAFGARHYQPHIKILRPGSEIDRDRTELGAVFRMCFTMLELGKYEVKTHIPRRPKHGK